MSEQEIFDAFMALFRRASVDKSPKDSYEDRLYDEASLQFSMNCEVIQSQHPDLAGGLDDDEMWYDDIRDEVVQSYCLFLSIDWDAVLEDQKEELLDKMKRQRAFDESDDRNSLVFQIFDLQERVGLIENGDYEKAYRLISEEWGDEYFNEFMEEPEWKGRN